MTEQNAIDEMVRLVEADAPQSLLLSIAEHVAAIDPRDSNPFRFGPFRDHNCWRCHSGKLPCVNGAGNEWKCDTLHARND